MTAILDLPLSSAIDYIFHALEKEKEQAAWELWQGLYPFMMSGFVKQISFGEFQRELIKPQIRHSDKSPEEIEKEIMQVVTSYEHKQKKEVLPLPKL